MNCYQWGYCVGGPNAFVCPHLGYAGFVVGAYSGWQFTCTIYFALKLSTKLWR